MKRRRRVRNVKTDVDEGGHDILGGGIAAWL